MIPGPIVEGEESSLYPLSEFRRRNGVALPEFRRIEGVAMPRPHRDLLVHCGDMTSRLEAFYGGPVILEVLHCEHTASVYRREVVLHAESSALPVEYGAIEINLEAFSEELRAAVIEAHLPLGGLLNRFQVHYHSQPVAFLELGPDPVLCSHFALASATRFFGRCNELIDGTGARFARIVEVLRP